MDVAISRADHAQMLALARQAHPQECCGLLLGASTSGGFTVRSIVPAANIAANPHRGFEIDPAVVLRVHREARESGGALLGWYHSHPNGRTEPSPEDAVRAREAGRLWLIIANGDMRVFVSTDAPGFRDARLVVTS